MKFCPNCTKKTIHETYSDTEGTIYTCHSCGYRVAVSGQDFMAISCAPAEPAEHFNPIFTIEEMVAERLKDWLKEKPMPDVSQSGIVKIIRLQPFF